MCGALEAADAHDAGRAGPCGEKPGAADAHDAGRALPCAGNQRQLMLMMPIGFGRLGRTRAS